MVFAQFYHWGTGATNDGVPQLIEKLGSDSVYRLDGRFCQTRMVQAVVQRIEQLKYVGGLSIIAFRFFVAPEGRYSSAKAYRTNQLYDRQGDFTTEIQEFKKWKPNGK